MPSEPLPLSLDDDDDPPPERTRNPKRRDNNPPVSDKQWRWRVGAVVILSALLLTTLAGIILAIRGCGKKEEDTSSGSGSSGSFRATRFDVEDLYADYKANQIAADGKYKNQVLEVVGIVKEIKKDSKDNPYVEFVLQKNRYMSSGRADFPKYANSQLAQLSKGQQITVRGRCEGLYAQGVILNDCVLLK